MLDITEIRFKKIEKGSFLGYASICISDLIVIKDIKLFDGKNGRYIIMPGARLKREEARQEILNKISKKYDEGTEE